MITTRPMLIRDTNSVMQIENESFRMPWTLEEMIRVGKMKRVIRLVAEMHGVVMGYLIYAVEDDHYEIYNLAVYEGARRHKIGTHLVERITDKLCKSRRPRVTLAISESNLGGQLFFKSQAFRALSVERHYFINGDSAYMMQRHISDPVVLDWKRRHIANLARAIQAGH